MTENMNTEQNIHTIVIRSQFYVAVVHSFIGNIYYVLGFFPIKIHILP